MNINLTNLTKTQVALLFAGGLLVAGLLFAIFYGRGAKQSLPPVALKVWGTDPKQYVEPLLGAYSAYRTNVTMSYEQIDSATYKERLMDALAAGQGPDIFFIKNTWVAKEKNKMYSALPQVMSPARIDTLYPAVVAQDLVRDDKVWGLPLYIDTLALYWNKSAFDQAGIVSPPRDWTQLQAMSQLLTRKDPATSQISRAGIALGADGSSIFNAPDILTNLIEQNGVTIAKEGAGAQFATESREALRAFNFYLNFGNPGSEFYSWNAGLGDSRSAFSSGKAAMVIDYGSAGVDIKTRNAFVPMRVAALPQAAEDAVNTASYDALAVSRQCTSTAYAWEFLTYTLATPEVSNLYLSASGRSPALLSLLGAVTDQQGAIFARQALTARSWPVPDDAGVKKAFNDAISAVFAGTDTARALDQAQEYINVLIRAIVR